MDLDLGDTRLIIAEAKRRGVLRNQLAYILATAYWETNRTMKPVREAYWLSENWRKRNLRYYPWYGRGFVQLTWQRNYLRAAKALDMDLTSDPDRVMEPKISARILVQGSMEGWFTGKKIPDFVTLQKSDFRGARRVINGTDKASTIAEIARKYDDTLSAAGYGVEPEPRPDMGEITHPDPAEAPQGWLAALVTLIRNLVGAK